MLTKAQKKRDDFVLDKLIEYAAKSEAKPQGMTHDQLVVYYLQRIDTKLNVLLNQGGARNAR